MRKHRVFAGRVAAGVLFAMAVGLSAGLLVLLTRDVSGTPVSGPLPPPVMPPNIIVLDDVEQLGKFMIYDITLSTPRGYACETCHIPTTGFTGPVSIVNLVNGTMPGVVPGRFSNRKPQSYVYSTWSPVGPFFNVNKGVWEGGNFWDGRVTDTFTQAMQPPINPVEMANIPVNGVFPPTFGGFADFVSRLQAAPYVSLIFSIYGTDVFTKYSTQDIYNIFAAEVAAYQATGEVNGFSSKWDASIYGGIFNPPLYTFTASEERGRILYGVGPNPNNDPTFGAAQCFQCHSSAPLPNITQAVNGRDTFTMYCYANLGNPRNLSNPYYGMFDNQPGGCVSNPNGCNPLGTKYVDFGLGANPNPAPDGTVFNGSNGTNNSQFLGLFKTPSTRSTGLVPFPGFVKAYMHNGVHKSLTQVVNFYNTRNIAVNAAGQQVAFDLTVGPPAGFNRIWGPPEVNMNVQNSAGLTPAQAAAMGTTGVTAMNGQVGNLQLTPQQVADVVAFLNALSDGFTLPNPIFPGM